MKIWLTSSFTGEVFFMQFLCIICFLNHRLDLLPTTLPIWNPHYMKTSHSPTMKIKVFFVAYKTNKTATKAKMNKWDRRRCLWRRKRKTVPIRNWYLPSVYLSQSYVYVEKRIWINQLMMDAQRRVLKKIGKFARSVRLTEDLIRESGGTKLLFIAAARWLSILKTYS